MWCCYYDTKKDKVGAIEDDHVGVVDMIKSRPDWKFLGYHANGDVHTAIAYAEQVFMNRRKPNGVSTVRRNR